MLLTFDLDQSSLLSAPRGGAKAVYVAKWGLPSVLRLECWRGKNRATFTDPVITFMVKDAIENAESLVTINEWTADSTGYTAVLSFNTVAFNEAIGTAKKLDTVCEIQIQAEEGDFVSQTVPLSVLRPVITGDEGTPLAQPDPEQWLDARSPRFDKTAVLNGEEQAQLISNFGFGDSVTRNVGTTAGTVAAGDDSRFSDARTPLAHTHSAADIADLGDAATRNVGTAAGTVAAGDDVRFTFQGITGTLYGNAIVFVDPSGTDLQRGAALVAAYEAAKLLTPNGLALSAFNRAAVSIPPGNYKLTATLTLDGEFVDLIASVPAKPSPRREFDVDNIGESNPIDFSTYRPGFTVVYSETDYVSTITQLADNVKLYGFTVAHLGLGVGFLSENLFLDALDWGALLIGPGCDNATSLYQDMYFWSACSTFATCGGVRAYESFSGTWIGCVSNSASFRCGYGDKIAPTAVFSAKMYDCMAGPFSFVGDYPTEARKPFYSIDPSTRFERCVCIGYSFDGVEGACGFAGCNITGISIPAGVVFLECVAGNTSFGIGNTINGTFIRCRGGAGCFGSTNSDPSTSGTFAGYAEDCFAGSGSFGGNQSGYGGKCTGTLVRCTVTGNELPMSLEGATIRDSRITTITSGINAVELLDSTSVISNSDIIVFQGSTGVPIYAATAKSVAAYHCRMNNASNDANGLGGNVTNLVPTPYNVVSDHVQ